MLLWPLNASSDSILPGEGGGLPSIDLRGFAAGKKTGDILENIKRGDQKAVPKTKFFREEVHFFRKSVQICAQIMNCTARIRTYVY